MFTDERRCEVWDEIRQHGIRAFSRQLTPEVFTAAAARTGIRLAKSPLYVVNLIWLGIAAAIQATESFAFILTTTLKLLEQQQEFSQSKLGKAREKGKRRKSARRKHTPQRDDPTQVSEEAFCKARQRMPLEFWLNVLVILGERFAAQHGKRHRFRGFRVLAMDGTRLDLPNWKALKDHFGTAKNKSGGHKTQARMVMLQFPFTRLPYRYELTPVKEGEPTLALRLIESLQPNDLVLLDAGFWSYRLLWAIARKQAFFAIRLRRRLNLRTLKREGHERWVRWAPKDSRGQWRKLHLPKSIDMRIIDYRIPGFRPQAIVTSVLDAAKISRDDWTRLTTDCEEAGKKLLPGLYHRRWEIETTYRELKVHQGLDRQIRSRTPASIQYEVAGHVVLYLLTRWLMVEAAVKHGLDPLRLSFVDAQRELNAIRPSLIIASAWWATHHLIPELLDRLATHQVLIRPGRHYPRKKKRKNHARKTQSKSKVTPKG